MAVITLVCETLCCPRPVKLFRESGRVHTPSGWDMAIRSGGIRWQFVNSNLMAGSLFIQTARPQLDHPCRPSCSSRSPIVRQTPGIVHASVIACLSPDVWVVSCAVGLQFLTHRGIVGWPVTSFSSHASPSDFVDSLSDPSDQVRRRHVQADPRICDSSGLRRSSGASGD